jgi:predicted transcriptional regulator
MEVREVMRRSAGHVYVNDSVLEAAREMKRHNISVLPVFEGDDLVGMITDWDVAVGCVATGRHPEDCLVKDYMQLNPVCIGPEEDVQHALSLMGIRNVRRLWVVEDGRTIGVITIGDVAMRGLEASAYCQGAYC